ncbi:MAG: citrate lyase subunit gamma [Clostridia bacterium]|jgi:citrate lyase subunit gamma (acyl carrier protein)|nr:citrate lyase subunit gamma [Clostridia bacterium]
MEVKNIGTAGTMESSDIIVTIKKNDKEGIEIELQSSVEQQFGKQIRKVIIDSLQELQIKDAVVIAVDKGAIDCAIKARVYAAAYRACESKDYIWEVSKCKD